ncbi:hypothetical protein BDY21DRAFT_352908 [Lineolata rhizophorae]|uniref:Uncharacterized protein n=1 Tax=Lineolata rhizophorae TaxID=578093 RepID=A0A6A6NRN1_9PEZI|nr:hypothetical protein BDY21DRAFT_352908 [Lineolata rhizophorae]
MPPNQPQTTQIAHHTTQPQAAGPTLANPQAATAAATNTPATNAAPPIKQRTAPNPPPHAAISPEDQDASDIIASVTAALPTIYQASILLCLSLSILLSLAILFTHLPPVLPPLASVTLSAPALARAIDAHAALRPAVALIATLAAGAAAYEVLVVAPRRLIRRQPWPDDDDDNDDDAAAHAAAARRRLLAAVCGVVLVLV